MTGLKYWSFALFSLKFISHGNDSKKEYRSLVVVIFYFCNWISRGYLFALGMADTDSSLSLHFVCEGDGHYVRILSSTILFDHCSKGSGFFLRTEL